MSMNWKQNAFIKKPITEADKKFRAVYEQSVLLSKKSGKAGPLEAMFDLWKQTRCPKHLQDASPEAQLWSYKSFLYQIGAAK